MSSSTGGTTDFEEVDSKVSKGRQAAESDERPGNGAVYSKDNEVDGADETAPLQEPDEKAPLENEHCSKQKDGKTEEGAAFAAENDVCIYVAGEQRDFCCLTKEELEKYAKCKKWRGARIGLFILFWVIWVALLAAAIVVVIRTPKCPERPQQVWWEKSTAYQIFPKSFKDSDADGMGDIKGIIEKMGYFDDGIKSNMLYMNSLILGSDLKKINPELGTMADFDNMMDKLQKKAMKVVVDFPVSQPSSADAMKEIQSAMRFWLDKGLDGFVFSATEMGTASNNETYTGFKTVMNEAEKGWGNERCLIVKADDGDAAKYKQYAHVADIVIDTSFTKVPTSCGTSEKLDAQCLQKMVDTGLAGGIVPGWQTSSESVLRMADRIPDDPMDVAPTLVTFMARGTPFLYYGEELGMKGSTANKPSPMQWTSGSNAGFTTGTPWEDIPKDNALFSVSARQASGAAANIMSLVIDLIKLRDEPSMLWGETKTFVHAGVFILTRKAKGFDGYVLFLNLEDNNKHVSISDIAEISKNGEVTLRTPNLKHQDFNPGSKIMLDSVLVHEKSGVVAKFMN